MPEDCGRSFDEAFLSGYLDGALVQRDEQRVRIHLDDCLLCRNLVDELVTMREATMSATFESPRDHEWSEAPRTGASSLFRALGWPVVIAWGVVVGAYAAWEGWREADNLVGQLMLVGGASGFAMLFFGVLFDRLQAMKTDRYRGIQK